MACYGLRMRRPFPSDRRGLTDIGWLTGRHSFSFGEWRDPERMRYRSLRVLNDDLVAPGGGFAEHAHHDMEIVTVVLEGALRHRDSLGHEETLRAGEVQVMSAGTGIRHSEFNASQREPVHFIQTWLLPRAQGLPPRYAQRAFDPERRPGTLVCVATGAGAPADGALAIGQDASLWVGAFRGRERTEHALVPGRAAYVHVMRGAMRAADVELGAGDAVAIEDELRVTLEGIGESADVLMYDLG